MVDTEHIAQALVGLVSDKAPIDTAADDEVRSSDVHARGEDPQPHVPDVHHAGDAAQHSSDGFGRRVGWYRRSEDADGLAGNAERTGHDEQSNTDGDERVDHLPPRRHYDQCGEDDATRGDQIAEHLDVRARDVGRRAAQRPQKTPYGHIDAKPAGRNEQHWHCGDIHRVPQAGDRGVDDVPGKREEQQGRRQRSGDLEQVGAVAAIPPGDAAGAGHRRGQGHPETRGVGRHVSRFRHQGQRAGQIAGGELDHREGAHHPEGQRERPRADGLRALR